MMGHRYRVFLSIALFCGAFFSSVPLVSAVSTTTPFTRNLSLWSRGADVTALQQFLNTNGFTVAKIGPGSLGNETTTFGPATYRAVVRYQTASLGRNNATGYVGGLTRAALNNAAGTTSSPASSLTSAQITAILSILQSFGADPDVVEKVRISLGGSATNASPSSTTATATSTIPSVVSGGSSGGGGNSTVVPASSVTSPTLTTDAASSVALIAATLNATITATGGADASQSGFAWGTNSILSGGDTATTTDGAQTGTASFTHTLSSLGGSTTYYFRAYATNSAGTSYGTIQSFQTLADVSGNPIVLYTDITSGPTTGGENDKGIYLSIFGKNFGTTTDMGTNTKVYIGGVEVDNYRSLGPSRVWADLGIAQITVQVGALGSPTQGVAIPINIKVNGVDSNTDQTFTPNPGSIYFVSNGTGTAAAGDDTSGTGSITSPWRTVQKGNQGTTFAIASASTNGAWGQVRAGDFIIMRGGTWNDSGDATYFVRANNKSGCAIGSNCANGGGTTSGPITVMGYPGETAFINNAYAGTDASLTTCAGGAGSSDSTVLGAISSANSSQSASNFGQYINIVNLKIEGGNDDGVINTQTKGDAWRIVNNELTATTSVNNMCQRAAGIAGSGINEFWVGNYIHDIRQGAPRSDGAIAQDHGIYVGDDPAEETTAYEIAYNHIVNIFDGNGFQTHGSGSGSINNINFHHNYISNAYKHGINIADDSQAGFKIWNNLVASSSQAGIRFGGTSILSAAKIFNNTFYNTGMGGDNPSSGAIVNDMSAVANQADIENNMFIPHTGSKYNTGTNNPNLTGMGTTTNNLWYNGVNGVPAVDSFAVSADPLFISTTAGSENFALQAESPVIDVGSTTAAIIALVTNDFTATTTRPQAGIFDIGAYEFVSPKPYPVTYPTVSSSPTAGSVVTVTTGTWGNNPIGYSYQWQTNGVNVSGQTSSTYTPVNTEIGKTIGCIVTATNGSGQVTTTVTGGTIASPPDSTPPSIPSGLTITNGSVTSIAAGISWNASTDNVLVSGYRIARNNVFIATTTSTSYTDSGLSASTLYTYAVGAFDPLFNYSATSTPNVSTTTLPVALAVTATTTMNHVNGVTTNTVNFTALPSAGDTVVVACSGRNTVNNTISAQDSLTGAFTLATSTQEGAGFWTAILYRDNIGSPGGSYSVTVTTNSSYAKDCAATSVSGAITSSSLDKVATLNPTVNWGSGPLGDSTTTPTLSQSNEIAFTVIAGYTSQQFTNISQPSGYTLFASRLGSPNVNDDAPAGIAYQIVNSTSAITTTWIATTTPNAANFYKSRATMSVATFKGQ